MRWGWIGAGVLAGVVLFLAGMLVGRASMQPPPAASEAEAEADVEAQFAAFREKILRFQRSLEDERLLNAQLEWWIGHVAPNAIGCAMPLGPDAGGPAFRPSGHVLGPSKTAGRYRIACNEPGASVGTDCVIARDGRVVAALTVTHVLADHVVAEVSAQAQGTEIRKGDAVWFVQ